MKTETDYAQCHEVNHNKFQRTDSINTILSNHSPIRTEVINSLKIWTKWLDLKYMLLNTLMGQRINHKFGI